MARHVEEPRDTSPSFIDADDNQDSISNEAQAIIARQRKSE